MTKPILIVQTDRGRPATHFTSFLALNGYSAMSVLLRSPADLPGSPVLDEVGAVVLPDAGPAAHEHAPSNVVLDWVRGVQARGLPLLAEGYGADLATQAAGGSVLAAAPSRAWVPLRASSEGRAAGLENADGQRALVWRSTRLIPAPNARIVLTDNAREPLAWCLGNALIVAFVLCPATPQYRSWLAHWRTAPGAASATVQTLAELEHAAIHHVPQCRDLAERLYRYWLSGLPH